MSSDSDPRPRETALHAELVEWCKAIYDGTLMRRSLSDEKIDEASEQLAQVVEAHAKAIAALAADPAPVPRTCSICDRWGEPSDRKKWPDRYCHFFGAVTDHDNGCLKGFTPKVQP